MRSQKEDVLNREAKPRKNGQEEEVEKKLTPDSSRNNAVYTALVAPSRPKNNWLRTDRPSIRPHIESLRRD